MACAGCSGTATRSGCAVARLSTSSQLAGTGVSPSARSFTASAWQAASTATAQWRPWWA